ncbi:hypothetical protein RFI_01773 [Reticulomyxa filosa]|uniref:Uncharacterized protein n=1 Tax=Reticulomyxa filosa TaxID=46433 RepID=X6P9Q7_RETFI|nr:hypothetical protein RFI_01773 [Reticulomyxa filosa]|eukprot:ETO35290.1 hypothetical protein RFI_01773 [Reticulomyxa filosa]
MLAFDVESDEKKLENETEIFSSSGCYNKDWVLFTNKSEKLNPLVCYICKQIANNAVELHCDEHENAEQVYLFGEECLQSYLKQSNGKCPIQQHEHCEFVKNKSSRQQISDLLVICPRQHDLTKKQLKEWTASGEREGYESQCNYKGKMKEMKDHLDKSCQLISIQHVISLVKELQSQLQTEKLKIEELKEMHLKSNTEIQQLNKQMNALQQGSLNKDSQIIELTKSIQQLKFEMNQTITQLKKQIEQCQSTFDTNTKLNDEIKQLKKEIQFKNDPIHQINVNNNEGKKENDFSHQLLQTKSKSNSTFIDYSTLDDVQLICSGSNDNTVRVWDFDSSKQIQSFNGHSNYVTCVKFSPYHYHNYRQNIICSSSNDKTIRFWDIKHNKRLQIFNQHTSGVCSIKFSSFNGGRYLCSGSSDKTIRLWDVEAFHPLHVFKGHEHVVWCVDISSLQSNNNNNSKSNSIGVIGGNGYTICSGSNDLTVRVWDIETTKQLIVFKGHENNISSVKYGPNELGNIGGANIILSGAQDRSIRLWDIRSVQQIQMFSGHTNAVMEVECSPFVVNNKLDVMDFGEEILCFKFIELKKKIKGNEQKQMVLIYVMVQTKV